MSTSPSGPGRITVEEAARRTGHTEDGTSGDGGGHVLLDVREHDEWRAGHIPGALLLPLSRLAAGESLPGEAEGRPLVVICRSGRRSQQAVDLLTRGGAEAVDVVGGMQEWALSGLPVVDAQGLPGTVA
ncbi:rhodanese-like domain-containing protein [Streptomyces longispororuber]|uniref:rhodanese-like domain-containing protein n=1 Tax=Streptomyces longispororuber TaxID=68230 RepID=UPI0021086258|nr:rhodanese-like domain-containing protein [Streptomyces longispororuber]MCQ4214739.1 rhodanese-like domain-containing protein [Streptomyces longispororuber]